MENGEWRMESPSVLFNVPANEYSIPYLLCITEFSQPHQLPWWRVNYSEEMELIQYLALVDNLFDHKRILVTNQLGKFSRCIYYIINPNRRQTEQGSVL
jgi:hypothetical protein